MGKHRHIAVLILGFMGLVRAYAQVGYVARLKPEVVREGVYAIPSLDRQPLRYRMSYAGHQFDQAASWQEHQQFDQVDLVFTLYPKQPEEWKVGYDSLMERRFRALEQRIPAVFQDKSVHWRLVIQTECNSMKAAQDLFHGFVLYPNFGKISSS
jgi:hypothetical protein